MFLTPTKQKASQYTLLFGDGQFASLQNDLANVGVVLNVTSRDVSEPLIDNKSTMFCFAIQSSTTTTGHQDGV